MRRGAGNNRAVSTATVSGLLNAAGTMGGVRISERIEEGRQERRVLTLAVSEVRVAGGLVAGDALAVNGRAEPAGRERGEHLPAGHLPPRQDLPAEGTSRVGASDAHDLQVLPEPMIPGPRPARGLVVDHGRNLVLDPALARTGLRRADQGHGSRAQMRDIP